eukprot:scaffold135249_cov38-Prasinocladus_malaysianus.AAC.1
MLFVYWPLGWLLPEEREAKDTPRNGRKPRGGAAHLGTAKCLAEGGACLFWATGFNDVADGRAIADDMFAL